MTAAPAAKKNKQQHNNSNSNSKNNNNNTNYTASKTKPIPWPKKPRRRTVTCRALTVFNFFQQRIGNGVLRSLDRELRASRSEISYEVGPEKHSRVPRGSQQCIA